MNNLSGIYIHLDRYSNQTSKCDAHRHFESRIHLKPHFVEVEATISPNNPIPPGYCFAIPGEYGALGGGKRSQAFLLQDFREQGADVGHLHCGVARGGEPCVEELHRFPELGGLEGVVEGLGLSWYLELDGNLHGVSIQ